MDHFTFPWWEFFVNQSSSWNTLLACKVCRFCKVSHFNLPWVFISWSVLIVPLRVCVLNVFIDFIQQKSSITDRNIDQTLSWNGLSLWRFDFNLQMWKVELWISKYALSDLGHTSLNSKFVHLVSVYVNGPLRLLIFVSFARLSLQRELEIRL